MELCILLGQVLQFGVCACIFPPFGPSFISLSFYVPSERHHFKGEGKEGNCVTQMRFLWLLSSFLIMDSCC